MVLCTLNPVEFRLDLGHSIAVSSFNVQLQMSMPKSSGHLLVF